MIDDLDAQDDLTDERTDEAARQPLLDQREIDALAGFVAPSETLPKGDWRAMADAGAPRSEPLPILQAAFANLADRLAGHLRALLNREVEVAAAIARPDRYGSAIEDIVLPSCIATFRAESWDGEGLVVIGPAFAETALGCLMGAGRGSAAGRPPMRPFTAIERTILGRLVSAMLLEAEAAFGEIAPTPLRLGRLETDPRLASIARPGDGVLVTTFRVDVEGRVGTIDLVLPWATMEPVRHLLRESFPGVKLGRDAYWASHLATEAGRSEAAADIILHEMRVPLRRIMDLAIGDTLMFETKPTDPVEVRCGRLSLTRGRIGHVDGRIAVRVTEPLRGRGPRGEQARGERAIR